MKLGPEEMAFLGFHAARPAPHAWAWSGGQHPDTWTKLTAWRWKTDARKTKVRCSISREGLAALSPYWIEAFTPNVAGLAVLEAAAR